MPRMMVPEVKVFVTADQNRSLEDVIYCARAKVSKDKQVPIDHCLFTGAQWRSADGRLSSEQPEIGECMPSGYEVEIRILP